MSLKNFGLVRGLSADKVFNYHNRDVVEKICTLMGNALKIAVNTILEGKTTKQVTGAIRDKGRKVAIILPYKSPHLDVKVIFSMLPDLLKQVCLMAGLLQCVAKLSPHFF